jgi:hypothetical protein
VGCESLGGEVKLHGIPEDLWCVRVVSRRLGACSEVSTLFWVVYGFFIMIFVELGALLPLFV